MISVGRIFFFICVLILTYSVNYSYTSEKICTPRAGKILAHLESIGEPTFDQLFPGYIAVVSSVIDKYVVEVQLATGISLVTGKYVNIHDLEVDEIITFRDIEWDDKHSKAELALLLVKHKVKISVLVKFFDALKVMIPGSMYQNQETMKSNADKWFDFVSLFYNIPE